MYNQIPSTTQQPLRVGLMGYGKAGQAVANVLMEDPRCSLQWVARKHVPELARLEGKNIPFTPSDQDWGAWLDQHPVDAIVDFSHPDAVYQYGAALAERGIMLVSANSAHQSEHLEFMAKLGQQTQVLCSPNITLGINFLILAAKLLRNIAPFADVAILEQHFKHKEEISGTARRIAETLSVEQDQITSLRLGGIVGHHEVIFGFPYQTVRLIHNSIKREAFGTGAVFALHELETCPPGLYNFDELLERRMRQSLLQSASPGDTPPLA